MSRIPKEFDPHFIAEQSTNADQIYHKQNTTKEPMASVLADNPDIYFVPPQRRSDWGIGPLSLVRITTRRSVVSILIGRAMTYLNRQRTSVACVMIWCFGGTARSTALCLRAK